MKRGRVRGSRPYHPGKSLKLIAIVALWVEVTIPQVIVPVLRGNPQGARGAADDFSLSHIPPS